MRTTLRAAGVDFHAEQQGERPRAVFLHGFGADLHTWDDVWSALGGRLPALRYDLRGFGRSRGPAGTPYSHADDLLAILDASALGQCDLIGVSMGGGVALNFALDHPQRVRRLILISPTLVAWEWSDAWLSLWRPIVTHACRGEMDEAKRLWWEHPLFGPTRNSPGAAALRESIQRFSGAQWIGDAHRLMLPDVERLHLLSTPTLLLTGARDYEDFRVIAALIEASAGDLERIDHPERGHLLHLEDPQGCAREIGAFLDG
jgi:pimeloyl-ACP methyl ester carboxylesterase